MTDSNGEPAQSFQILKGKKIAIAEAFSRSGYSKNAVYCIRGDELASYYKPFLQLARSKITQGGSVRILADIHNRKDIYSAVAELQSIGVQVRHLSSPHARRCVIYDKIAFFSVAYMPSSTLSTSEQADADDLWITCTDADVLEIAKRQFEIEWAGATDVAERMAALKDGRIEEDTLIVRDTQKAIELYKSIAATTRQEALWILPSPKSVLRVKRGGIFDILVSAAAKGADVKILCPQDDDNSSLIKELTKLTSNMEIKKHEPVASTILIVDRQFLFTSELRNDDTDDIGEALGISVFSSSIPTIQSHITLFRALWHQQESYEQLDAAYRIKEDFINIAAHELRTPILPIVLMAESLMAEFEEQGLDKQSESVKIIVRNVNRLKSLIGNILDATRVENKSFALDRRRWDVAQFLQTVIADEKMRLSHDSRLRIEFQNNLPKGFQTSFDKERLGQVVHNLIDNAIKFTRTGKVTILTDLHEGNESITIAVRDTGKGIDPEIVSRLFTKFTTKSTERAGTGLGLYISKAIVEAHGGKIWAENNKDGEGATFTLTLPLAEEEESV